MMCGSESPHVLELTADTLPDVVTDRLLAFLDSDSYTAIAVVHGEGDMAPEAFETAVQRLVDGRGVVWVKSPTVLDQIPALGAEILDLFRPIERYLVNFISVRTKRIAKSLTLLQVSAIDIDEAYIEAGLD